MPKFYTYVLTSIGQDEVAALIKRYGYPHITHQDRRSGPWKIKYSRTFDLYRPSIAALMIIKESFGWAKHISEGLGIQENTLLQQIEMMGPANLEGEPSPEEALEILEGRGLIRRVAGPNISASEGTVVL